jgi:hypothetical protein
MSPLSESVFEVNEPMVISETIDEETIIINLTTGNYFSLKHSGSAIWAGIQQSVKVADMAALVRSQFDAANHDVEPEIAALVERLIAEDLIRHKDGPASALGTSSVGDAHRQPYLPPLLDKFTDMEAMLLLDPVHDVDEQGWPQVPSTDGKKDA